MEKKGQITVFIILSVILLIVIAGTFFLKDYIIAEKLAAEEPTKLPVAAVTSFVQSCLERMGNEAVEYNAVRGGYFEPPPEYVVDVANLKIAYFFDEGSDRAPAVEVLQEELSKNIKTTLNNCLQDFTVFKEQGYHIETEPINVNSVFKDKVLVDLIFPITISKGKSSTTLTRFSSKINVNIPAIISIYESIIEQQKTKPTVVMASFLSKLASEKEVLIELTYVNEGTVLYIITDENALVNSEPYQFVFAMKYNRNGANDA